MATTTQDRPARMWILASLLALVFSLGWLASTDLLVQDHERFELPFDHHKYAHMAEIFEQGGKPFRIAPFCWRVGIPLLVSVLPGSNASMFMMVGFVAIWLTGISTFGLILQHFSNRLLAFLGLFAFYSLGWAVRFPLYDFWLPDAASFLIIVLAIISILQERWYKVAGLLALGVLVKESVVFVVPLCYSLGATRRGVEWWRLGRTVLVGLPAIAILVALRISMPALNQDHTYVATLSPQLANVQYETSDYDLRSLAKRVSSERLERLSLSELHSYLVAPFGLLVVLLLLVGLRSSWQPLVRYSPFLALVAAQLVVANNTERLLVLAFPAVIVAAISSVRSLAERLPLAPWVWGAYLTAITLAMWANDGVFSVPFRYEATLLFACCAIWLPTSRFLRHRTELSLDGVQLDAFKISDGD